MTAYHREPRTVPTAKQLEVLQLLADGLMSKEIATQLWLSTDSVKSRIDGARFILGAKTTTQTVVLALRLGLIT